MMLKVTKVTGKRILEATSTVVAGSSEKLNRAGQNLYSLQNLALALFSIPASVETVLWVSDMELLKVSASWFKYSN